MTLARVEQLFALACSTTHEEEARTELRLHLSVRRTEEPREKRSFVQAVTLETLNYAASWIEWVRRIERMIGEACVP